MVSRLDDWRSCHEERSVNRLAHFDALIMLTIEEARALLGDDCTLTDEEIGQLLAQLFEIGLLVIEAANNDGQAALHLCGRIGT